MKFFLIIISTCFIISSCKEGDFSCELFTGRITTPPGQKGDLVLFIYENHPFSLKVECETLSSVVIKEPSRTTYSFFSANDQKNHTIEGWEILVSGVSLKPVTEISLIFLSTPPPLNILAPSSNHYLFFDKGMIVTADWSCIDENTAKGEIHIESFELEIISINWKLAPQREGKIFPLLLQKEGKDYSLNYYPQILPKFLFIPKRWGELKK